MVVPSKYLKLLLVELNHRSPLVEVDGSPVAPANRNEPRPPTPTVCAGRTMPLLVPVTVGTPLIVNEVSVPTLVREEETTLLASVVLVKVLASAVIVIFAEPSKLMPLILRTVASFVAVAALPVIPLSVNAMVWVVLALSRKASAPAAFQISPETGELGAAIATGILMLAVLVADAASVSFPAMVNPLSVPTLVSEEVMTLLASEVPDNVPAAAATVI